MANFIEHVTALNFVYSALVRHEARADSDLPLLVHHGVPLSDGAIGMAVALDAVYVALDRAARITEGVEEAPCLCQLEAQSQVGLLGPCEAVLKGGAEQPIANALIHIDSLPIDPAGV